jgi:predicted nucleic acid-binding Zn ribbon protein
VSVIHHTYCVTCGLQHVASPAVREIDGDYLCFGCLKAAGYTLEDGAKVIQPTTREHLNPLPRVYKKPSNPAPKVKARDALSCLNPKCGKPFTAGNNRRKYRSNACRVYHFEMTHPRKQSFPDRDCAACGKPFAPRRRIDTACSADCHEVMALKRCRERREERKEPHKCQSPRCQNTVMRSPGATVPKYCSKPCQVYGSWLHSKKAQERSQAMLMLALAGIAPEPAQATD